jgi:hypothetical protein
MADREYDALPWLPIYTGQKVELDLQEESRSNKTVLLVGPMIEMTRGLPPGKTVL